MPDMNLKAIPAMKNALEQIQELHKPVWVTYLGVPGLVCDACREPVESEPCPTRKLADEALDRMARTNQGGNK